MKPWMVLPVSPPMSDPYRVLFNGCAEMMQPPELQPMDDQ